MDTPCHMARMPSRTGLYWNERGHIGCARHVPYKGSDTWNWERWEPVPADVLHHELGRELRCETCGLEITR